MADEDSENSRAEGAKNLAMNAVFNLSISIAGGLLVYFITSSTRRPVELRVGLAVFLVLIVSLMSNAVFSLDAQGALSLLALLIGTVTITTLTWILSEPFVLRELSLLLPTLVFVFLTFTLTLYSLLILNCPDKGYPVFTLNISGRNE